MKVLKFIVVSVVLATLLINTNVTVFAQEYEWQQLFTRPGLDGDPNNPSEDVWDYVPKEKSRDNTSPEVSTPFAYKRTIFRNQDNVTCNDIVVVSETVAYAACNRFIYKLTTNSQGVMQHTVSLSTGLGIAYNFYSIKLSSNNKLYAAGGVNENGLYSGVIFSKSLDDADQWMSVSSYSNKMFTTLGVPSESTLYDNGIAAVGPSYANLANTPEGVLKYPSSRPTFWRPFNVEGIAGRSFGNQLAVIDSGSSFQYYVGGSRFCKSTGGIDWSCTAPANGAESFINGVAFFADYFGGIVGSVGSNFGWFRTTDNGGLTWSARKFTANQPFNSLTWSKYNSNAGWIAAGNITSTNSTGGIYITMDSGFTWTRSPLPVNDTKMVQCSAHYNLTTQADTVACIGQRVDTDGYIVSDIYTATVN